MSGVNTVRLGSYFYRGGLMATVPSFSHQMTDEQDAAQEPKLAGPFCLLDVPCGKKLRVQELTGTPSIRSRLYSLGILPGTEMEVCKNGGSQCVCVRVRQSSVVLGDGMAEAVYCSPVDDTALSGPHHGAGRKARAHRRRGAGKQGACPCCCDVEN